MIRAGFILSVLFLTVCSSAYGIGGPATTRRERLAAQDRQTGREAQPQKASPAEGLREEIERSFLLEDFSAAERLARDYAAQHAPAKENREVEYLRAASLLKLRRPEQARPLLEKLLAGSADPRERERLESALAQARPGASLTAVPASVAPPKAVLIVPQHAVEEIPRFSVQIGSFSKEKNARSLLRQLSERRYPAYIEHGSTALYRVRVGPLDSREEAVRTEALLKKDGYPAKIIP